MKICPNCQFQNREGILFCDNCGQPLRDVPSIATKQFSKAKLEMAGPANSTWGTARFGTQASLIVHVRDVATPVVLKPAERPTGQIVMGRMDITTKVSPDFDLTPFGAQEKGVSRVHAAIRRNEESLLLVDLGSVNGTYLNGQRLTTDQPHVLRDGDEIRLGKLVLHVYFK
jgi:hypothetical protein